jgi:hypothetical protein
MKVSYSKMFKNGRQNHTICHFTCEGFEIDELKNSNQFYVFSPKIYWMLGSNNLVVFIYLFENLTCCFSFQTDF